jgi:hypothetical protein
MKLVGATGDWTVHTNTHILPVLTDVYRLLGADDRITAETFTFPHNYNQTSRNAVYPFLTRWLMGFDDSEKTKEGTQQPETPENLLAFDSEHPAPAEVKSPEQLENALIARLREQIDAMSPQANAGAWGANRERLLTALRIRTGLDNPGPRVLQSVEVRRSAHPGVTIVHHELRRPDTPDVVPVVEIIPEKTNGHAVIVGSAHGKAGLMDASQAGPSALVMALLQQGHTVIGFDPLFVGENQDAGKPTHARPDTAHYETYNKSLAADRMQDLATTVAWANTRARQVDVVAVDGMGPLALRALPAIEGWNRGFVDLEEFDEGDGSGEIGAGLDLPGAMQCGGLKAAAALAAPRPLWVVNASHGFDHNWPKAAYEQAGAAGAYRATAAPPDKLAAWLNGRP